MCVNVDNYRGSYSINFSVLGAGQTARLFYFFFTNLGPQCCIDQYAEIQTSVTQNLLEA